MMTRCQPIARLLRACFGGFGKASSERRTYNETVSVNRHARTETSSGVRWNHFTMAPPGLRKAAASAAAADLNSASSGGGEASNNRFAEGLDSIQNFVSSTSHTNSTEKAGALVCGVAQMGGLIFSILATTVALLGCLCAPIAASCCVWLCKCCWRARKRRSEREPADSTVEEVLAESVAFWRGVAA